MQNKVKEFNEKRNCHLDPMPVYARLLDIQSELGELAKEYLKHSNYGVDPFELDEEFKMEYGDVLYAFLSLAEELNIDANQCIDKVIDKYNARIAKNKTMGSSKN